MQSNGGSGAANSLSWIVARLSSRYCMLLDIIIGDLNNSWQAQDKNVTEWETCLVISWVFAEEKQKKTASRNRLVLQNRCSTGLSCPSRSLKSIVFVLEGKAVSGRSFEASSW
ncbi:hypothetical protein L1887_17097 [Cichorium endivia]|nr:hypothetical protein L1887_17097 [Cichorium endivia]